MEVILLRDIAGLGKKWEVKKVKNGYGRNFLLLRKLAVLATPRAVKDAGIRAKQEGQNRAVQEDLLNKSFESIKDFTFELERKANEKGHLFDGVDAKEIAAILEEKLKIKIPVGSIKLEKNIKEIGKHKAILKKGDKEVVFEVEVKPI